MPEGQLKKEGYVRDYLLTTISGEDDLPFTTAPPSVNLLHPRRVWVAVYVRTPNETSAPAGVRVVKQRSELPQLFHGGCTVVNLVADAVTGETLGSWCNIDTSPPVKEMTPLPAYLSPSGPFR